MSATQPVGALAFLAALTLLAAAAHGQQNSVSPSSAPTTADLHLPGGVARSGYSFLTPPTRALQDDAFANPGMLWVEQGETMWNAPSSTGPSCAGCHGEAAKAMRGVSAHYPRYDERAGHVVNLEQKINMCRVDHQNATPLPYESQELLSITAFVSRQSLGMPVAVAVDGAAASSFRRGKKMYETRLGQLDLGCAACHEQNVGQHLRAEAISQGQINGFPIYRQLWQTMGSTHRMFAWCNTAVRAEPLPAGSQDYVDLELYVRARGLGLPIETPAVRR
jgi:sulfur-oxidizing protein SoxA